MDRRCTESNQWHVTGTLEDPFLTWLSGLIEKSSFKNEHKTQCFEAFTKNPIIRVLNKAAQYLTGQWRGGYNISLEAQYLGKISMVFVPRRNIGLMRDSFESAWWRKSRDTVLMFYSSEPSGPWDLKSKLTFVLIQTVTSLLYHGFCPSKPQWQPFYIDEKWTRVQYPGSDDPSPLLRSNTTMTIYITNNLSTLCNFYLITALADPLQ